MPFSFSFSLFFFLRLFSFPFCRSPCPIPCSFFRSFLSFRLAVFRFILVSPSSLLLSLPCFPWWRILLFCYFVSALQPPRAPWESQVCVLPLRAVFFLALVMLTHLYVFSSLPFFDFDLDIVCFILSFSCGYHAVSRFRILLRLV